MLSIHLLVSSEFIISLVVSSCCGVVYYCMALSILCSAMNVSLYIVAFLSISGFLAAIEFINTFYILYPIVAIIG